MTSTERIPTFAAIVLLRNMAHKEGTTPYEKQALGEAIRELTKREEQEVVKSG